MNRADMAFFGVARELATLSDYKGPHIGCVVAQNRKLISSGYNSNKTNPTQSRYNSYREFNPAYPPKVHAEIAALNSLIGKPQINFPKLSLYIYREDRKGKLKNCRPCASCMALIKDLGIKHIYYTTNDGYAHEKLK